MNALTLMQTLPIVAHNGGLFISRGAGTHPDRTINSYELILVRTGALAIQEDTASFLIGAGDSLLLFPKRRHFGTRPYGKDLSFFWFHFDVTLPGPTEADGMNIPQMVASADSSTTEELMTLCRRFLDIQASARQDSRFQRSLLLLEMLAAIVARNERTTRPLPNRSGTRLADRANALLRVRFAESTLSTQTVADALGVNPDYLGRMFRKTFGKPITDVLHEYRLRHARSLLLDDSKNISEIAHVSGFADAGYFRRLFKKQFAISPQGFRGLHARTHVNTA